MVRRYNNTEKAFLFAYADHCLANDVDYKETVANGLMLLTQRRASWASIKDKLQAMLFQNGKSVSYRVQTFLETGTASLDIERIDPSVLKHMESHLAQWKLGPLDTDADAPSDESTIGESGIPALDEDEPKDALDSAEHQRKSPSSFQPEARQNVEDSEKTRKPKNNWDEIIEIRDSEVRDLDDVDQEIQQIPVQSSNKPGPDRDSATQPQNHVVATAALAPKPRASRAKAPIQYAESSGSSVSPESVEKRATGKRKATYKPEVGSSSKKPKTTAKNQTGARSSAGKRKATEYSEAGTSTKRLKLILRDPSGNSSSSGVQMQATNTLEMQLDALTNDNKTIKTQLRAVISVNSVLLNNYKTSAGGLSEQSVKDLQHTLNQIQHMPNQAFENMANDALAEGKKLASLRNLLKTIIHEYNPVNNGNDFPQVPQLFEQRSDWTVLRDAIVFTVGHDNDTPFPSKLSAGYLSARAEDIASSRVLDAELESCIRGLRKHLISPHALQLLLSALLCRLVFQSPEPLLDGEHTKGWLKLYEAVAVNDGLDQVQRFDKIALQMLFEDDTIKHTLTERRLQKVAQDFTSIAKEVLPPAKKRGPRSKNPEIWAAKAIEFKKTLLLSPKDYRIHFVEPGMQFDATWMQAVDARNLPISNEEAEGKVVAICLFPALEQRHPQAFHDGSKVEHALAENKRFFPTFVEKETFTPTEQMCLATVLLS
ncbi:hypothetical protein EKO04_001480 [Ascochyta lentis]|uniref:Uncharacterized protein n=1 Tax=Ascochyta lentis TaxID=205686 RepID=A0A8H7MKU2_9PLEO|nr:hypothetical protein EKO04_001480 [Ascochyta lentis]